VPAGTGIAGRAAGSAIGPVERRLLREPAVRRSVAVSVAIGLISAATIVVQAVALAALLTGAMGSATGSVLPPILWLAGAIAIRGLCALAGELVAGRGAEIAKAELRGRLLGAALRRASGGGADGGGVGGATWRPSPAVASTPSTPTSAAASPTWCWPPRCRSPWSR